MRYPPDHKAESRKRVVAAAAAQMRTKGVDGISVNEVMAAAGLTHGAFYAHFRSKDALVADAVSAIFRDTAQRGSDLDAVQAQPDADLPAAFRAYLESYLSPRHRDRPEHGCPFPSLSAEIARGDTQARRNFVAGLERMMEGITTILSRLGQSEPEAGARAAVAQMVGAIGLARTVGPGPESDRIIGDCLAALVGKFGL